MLKLLGFDNRCNSLVETNKVSTGKREQQKRTLCIQIDEFNQGVSLGTSKRSQRQTVEVENIQFDAKYSCDNKNGSMSTNGNVQTLEKEAFRPFR